MTRTVGIAVRNRPTSGLANNKAVSGTGKTKTGMKVKTPAEITWDSGSSWQSSTTQQKSQRFPIPILTLIARLKHYGTAAEGNLC
jgi:hypothetical protein